jgi:hypothetical protein
MSESEVFQQILDASQTIDYALVMSGVAVLSFNLGSDPVTTESQ